jgi:hypothetical protein
MVSPGRRALTLCAVSALGAACCAGSVLALGAAPGGAETSTTAVLAHSLSAVVIPNLGPGYAVTSQGPLDAAQFASDAPDPSAATGALSALGKTISTYERMWQANGGLNQVQDLVVKFPTATGATVFVHAADHALDRGEIVSKSSLASVPDAHLVTYFAATNVAGVGEAITMRAGIYVALVSFFSAAAGNPEPITPADAARVAQAQHGALLAAPGGKDPDATKSTLGLGGIGWAALAVAVVALAVSTPILLRRRAQTRQDAARAQTI